MVASVAPASRQAVGDVGAEPHAIEVPPTDFLGVVLCLGMAAILGSPLELPKLVGVLDTKFYLTQWPTEGAFCDSAL